MPPKRTKKVAEGQKVKEESQAHSNGVITKSQKSTKSPCPKGSTSVQSNSKSNDSVASSNCTSGTLEGDAQQAILSAQMKYCQDILNALWSEYVEEHAVPLFKPFDSNTPDSCTFWKNSKGPVNLVTVKANLVAGVYKRPEEFASDIHLSFSNCYRYYSSLEREAQWVHDLQFLFEVYYAHMPEDANVKTLEDIPGHITPALAFSREVKQLKQGAAEAIETLRVMQDELEAKIEKRRLKKQMREEQAAGQEHTSKRISLASASEEANVERQDYEQPPHAINEEYQYDISSAPSSSSNASTTPRSRRSYSEYASGYDTSNTSDSSDALEEAQDHVEDDQERDQLFNERTTDASPNIHSSQHELNLSESGSNEERDHLLDGMDDNPNIDLLNINEHNRDSGLSTEHTTSANQSFEATSPEDLDVILPQGNQDSSLLQPSVYDLRLFVDSGEDPAARQPLPPLQNLLYLYKFHEIASQEGCPEPPP